MALTLLLALFLLAWILPGLYQACRHILGYEFALIHKYGGSISIFILRVALVLVFSWFIGSTLLITFVFGLAFAMLNLFTPHWIWRFWKLKKYAARAILSGAIAGGIVGGISIGLFFLLSGRVATPGSTSVMALSGVIIGGLFGGLVNGVIVVLQFTGKQLGIFSFKLIAPLFILSRFARIICNHCYRITLPLKSRYDLGRRYCESCGQEVEDTKEPGKVAFVFGDFPSDPEGRVFVLSNPDFESKEHHIEVSEVYIDPETTDKRLLERFITYSVNYPPSRGLSAVHVSYQGELSVLGENLKNALHNTFEQIEKIA